MKENRSCKLICRLCPRKTTPVCFQKFDISVCFLRLQRHYPEEAPMSFHHQTSWSIDWLIIMTSKLTRATSRQILHLGYMSMWCIKQISQFQQFLYIWIVRNVTIKSISEGLNWHMYMFSLHFAWCMREKILGSKYRARVSEKFFSGVCLYMFVHIFCYFSIYWSDTNLVLYRIDL